MIGNLKRNDDAMNGDITEDDKLIWALNTGMHITCEKDMVMEDTGAVAFKAGVTYLVTSMHPIAVPAFIVVTNDQGETHRLEGSHVRSCFKR
jgi:hypothetical protein